MDANIDAEMDVELLPCRYCGKKGDALLSEFTPCKKVAIDKFIAIRPLDEAVEDGAPIWVAKVVGTETYFNGIVTSFKAL